MSKQAEDSFCVIMADQLMRVVPQSLELKAACQDYLCDCSNTDLPTIHLSQDDVAYEAEVSQAYYGYAIGNDLEYEKLALLRKMTELLCAFDTLLMHASSLMFDDKAYLFAATSGTGKSTHARMWRESFGNRIQMINDDKPFVRYIKDTIMVYGNIWNGKENLGNKLAAPLAGIVCLERGDENLVVELDAAKKHDFLYSQIHLSTEPKNRLATLKLIDTIVERIPIVKLRCTPTHEAAYLCYQALNEREAHL